MIKLTVYSVNKAMVNKSLTRWFQISLLVRGVHETITPLLTRVGCNTIFLTAGARNKRIIKPALSI